MKKKQELRNNEYYDIQATFDDLYDKSKNRKSYKFKNLMDIIMSPENIKLAYRNIKVNTGSKTAGVDKKTISYLASMDTDELIHKTQQRLMNYHPHEVRRVYIPKANGKMRPLGIPTIEDRLLQQCIKQVLEPICEGKFHDQSFGFRPNRSTHHAVNRCLHLMNRAHLKYVVDIDIKGFFDNVDHGKLLKQMWHLGIRDKSLLCVISKLLKAPIEGEGIPSKGTPQGGILSPLLSNIVLNELDWWISDQWDSYETYEHNYLKMGPDGRINHSNKYRALRRTGMKEIYLVRYADDFKIFCRHYGEARRIYHATVDWLDKRLGLEVSTEKSCITDLTKEYSEYLGFKFKLVQKGNKLVCHSHMTDKAIENVKIKLKNQVKEMKRDIVNVKANTYNSMVLGVHNYYKVATHVNIDFKRISYEVERTLYNRLRVYLSKEGTKSETYKHFYKHYKCKTYNYCGIKLFPLSGVTHKSPMGFTQTVCNYTEVGRLKIHAQQNCVSTKILRFLMENPVLGGSTEYNDNRLSLYVGQYGKCKVTGRILEIGQMDCHHIKPRSLGGTDAYKNLVFVTSDVHKLIHATEHDTIQRYLKRIGNIDSDIIKKLNKLRKQSGNSDILVV